MRSRGVDTRARLLDAAVALIAAEGWQATTSRAVAERAGVNNALVHYHFGSVDRLRRAAAAHAMEAEVGGAVQVMLGAPDVLDGVVEAMRALAAAGLEGTPSQRVIVAAMVHALADEGLRADLGTALAAFRDVLRDRLAAQQQAGRLHPDVDPDRLAAALAALVDGLILHAHVDPGLDVGAAMAQVTALARPGPPLNPPAEEAPT